MYLSCVCSDKGVGAVKVRLYDHLISETERVGCNSDRD